MQKHTKIYFNYFDIAYDPVSGWHDFIKCELCGLEAIDIHHIDSHLAILEYIGKPFNENYFNENKS